MSYNPHNLSFLIGIKFSANKYLFFMLFCSNLEASIPISSFSVNIFVFPCKSKTPYLLSFFTTYNPASLSINSIESYIIWILVSPFLDNTPTFLLLSTKKSPTLGRYVILSYLASKIVFPCVSITPHIFLFSPFLTTNIFCNIAFLLANTSLISLYPLSKTLPE